MEKQPSASYVKAICSTGIQKDRRFIVPIEIGDKTLRLRLTYWHERAAYVAEVGMVEENLWHGADGATAPSHVIEHLRTCLRETYGVQHLAGVKPINHRSIAEQMSRPGQIGKV